MKHNGTGSITRGLWKCSLGRRHGDFNAPPRWLLHWSQRWTDEIKTSELSPRLWGCREGHQGGSLPLKRSHPLASAARNTLKKRVQKSHNSSVAFRPYTVFKVLSSRDLTFSLNNQHVCLLVAQLYRQLYLFSFFALGYQS